MIPLAKATQPGQRGFGDKSPGRPGTVEGKWDTDAPRSRCSFGPAAASLDRPGPAAVRTVSEVAITRTSAGPGLNLQPADRSRKIGQRGGSKKSGGGGNRTPVRERSTMASTRLAHEFESHPESAHEQALPRTSRIDLSSKTTDGRPTADPEKWRSHESLGRGLGERLTY